MNMRHCFWTVVIVWAVLSFFPALLLTNLFGGILGRKGKVAG